MGSGSAPAVGCTLGATPGMIESRLVDDRKNFAMRKPAPFPIARQALLLAALIAQPAFAAPPAGHPSPAQARDMLLPAKPPSAGELPNEGTVLDVIHANEFTYLEIARPEGKEWIAVEKMEIRTGTRIRYEDGAVMQDFYSKLLKRTFPSVMFINHLAVTAQP